MIYVKHFKCFPAAFVTVSFMLIIVLPYYGGHFEKWPKSTDPLIKFLGPRNRIVLHIILHIYAKFGTFIRKITVWAIFDAKGPD